MSVTLASSTAGRIGQRVRLLGSDKTGDVVAAASAIKRTLRGAGLDMHAFADVTEKAFTPVSPPREGSVDADIGLVIKFCFRRAHELTKREWPFINDLDRLARRLGDRLVLTAKQEAWLFAIVERLRGVR
jgi:hypothetical protein